MLKYNINIDYSRDSRLPEVSLIRLKDSYMTKDDTSPQDLFARAACRYASNEGHAQRLYDYVSQQFFMFSTPIMANSGNKRGLGISCFLSNVQDSLQGITSHFSETVFLTAAGGGIGTYWNLRTTGKGKNGVIPWLKVADDLMLAGNQADTRRGSYAAYMDVSHPDIEEFVSIRDVRGDHKRKTLNAEGFHNAVCIPDAFMHAVEADGDWDLIDPATNEVSKTIKARDLMNKIIKTRIETGEPYLFFNDTVDKYLPHHLKAKGLKVTHSNLCNEIYLPTGVDYNGVNRTAICCLSSVNMATFDEWEPIADQMLLDMVEMLDNVLEEFINNAPKEAHQAVYSAKMTRDIGIGQMGFHTYLQKKSVPFESEEARVINQRLSYVWSSAAKKASRKLGIERGFYPDSFGENGYQHKQRNAHVLAVAPNASSGIICGNVSPSIEPLSANVVKNITISGDTLFKNPVLLKLLQQKGKDLPSVWTSIIAHEGSVQHLDFLSGHEKLVFKTWPEIDPFWTVTHVADRTPMICQGQSFNLSLLPEWILADPQRVGKLHMDIWKKGLKGAYYVRSKAVKSDDRLGIAVERKTIIEAPAAPTDTNCAACEG